MVKKLLKDKSGSSFPMTIAIVLICITLSCVVFEYSRLLIISKSVRDQLQEESISLLENNWSNMYPSLRDGYAGGYKYNSNNMRWEENTFVKNVFSHLDLAKEGNTYTKYVNNKKVYTISNVSVNLKNSTFAPRNAEGGLQIEIRARLNVPLTFGFRSVPELSTALVVKSKFIPKF